MTKEQFFRILKANNIPLDLICFDDNIKDDVFCINHNYTHWEVFYRERGKEFDVKKFVTESDALKCLLDKLKISYS